MRLAPGGIVALTLFMGCIDYSSYQDARIVERGGSQGTVAVSASKQQSEYAGDDFDWYAVDVNPRWGLGARFDAGFKMALLITGEEMGWVLVGGDLRFGAFRDYLALTVPVTMAFGELAFSTINLQPGIIMTLPVTHELDINGSVRRSFYLHEDLESNAWWLYNAGLGIKVAPEWRIRPEVAWMVSDHEYEQTTYVQFGIGVTRQVGPKASE
jgi:hypothetical protein